MRKPESFIALLASEGITLRLVEGNRFVSDPKNISEEIRGFIVANREAIKAEIEKGGGG